jgi:hypothetical protein
VSEKIKQIEESVKSASKEELEKAMKMIEEYLQKTK